MTGEAAPPKSGDRLGRVEHERSWDASEAGTSAFAVKEEGGVFTLPDVGGLVLGHLETTAARRDVAPSQGRTRTLRRLPPKPRVVTPHRPRIITRQTSGTTRGPTGPRVERPSSHRGDSHFGAGEVWAPLRRVPN